jgi:hypothetical protein
MTRDRASRLLPAGLLGGKLFPPRQGQPVVFELAIAEEVSAISMVDSLPSIGITMVDVQPSLWLAHPIVASMSFGVM